MFFPTRISPFLPTFLLLVTVVTSATIKGETFPFKKINNNKKCVNNNSYIINPVVLYVCDRLTLYLHNLFAFIDRGQELLNFLNGKFDDLSYTVCLCNVI